MKGWQSYLLWEGLPFLLLLFVFGFISAFNWDYERKLIVADPSAADRVDIHMGQILLAIALGQAFMASGLLFLVRMTRPKSQIGGYRYMFVSLVIVTVFLVFPAMFVVILGPAAITMMEQMRPSPK
jgi:hypothetical protein